MVYVPAGEFLMRSTAPEGRNHAFSLHQALVPLAAFADSLLTGVLPRGFATALNVSPHHPATYRFRLLIAPLLFIPWALGKWSNDRPGVAGWRAQPAAAGPGPHWGAAGLGAVGASAPYGMTGTPFRVFTRETVEPRWHAVMSGATTMAVRLSWAAAAFGGGVLVPAVGYRGLFVAGAAVSLVGFLIFWAHFIAPDRHVTQKTLALAAPS